MFLCNGRVAWPVMDHRISDCYTDKVYTLPAGWYMQDKRPEGEAHRCGCSFIKHPTFWVRPMLKCIKQGAWR